MSIVNGLFAGRSGIQSHGDAIAVIGDNISNASTVGFKSSRAEFEDQIAGGQTAGRVIGSGSTVNTITNIFEQGTLEITGRPTDLAVDGNGLFVVAEGQERFFTRAGVFQVDSAGFLVDTQGSALLGYSANGSGALQPLNINNVSQSSVSTSAVSISANLDSRATTVVAPVVGAPGTANGLTYAQVGAIAEFSTVVEVFDTLGASHTVSVFFYKTNTNEYTAHAYVNSDEVGDTPSGVPRLIGSTTMTFDPDGTRNNTPVPPAVDFTAAVPWNNGSTAGGANHTFTLTLDPATQYAASSNVLSISQDGQGVGAVTSVSIGQNGDIFALLDNGQSSIIGTVALVNFSNVEGLTRIGNNRLQQSNTSGEPIYGRPSSGTFGDIQSGSLELSTSDIASEFVKLITLQRGFQASSRIITTINQLLNEIIQLI